MHIQLQLHEKSVKNQTRTLRHEEREKGQKNDKESERGAVEITYICVRTMWHIAAIYEWSWERELPELSQKYNA